jgi:hypothetical protein
MNIPHDDLLYIMAWTPFRRVERAGGLGDWTAWSHVLGVDNAARPQAGLE